MLMNHTEIYPECEIRSDAKYCLVAAILMAQVEIYLEYRIQIDARCCPAGPAQVQMINLRWRHASRFEKNGCPEGAKMILLCAEYCPRSKIQTSPSERGRASSVLVMLKVTDRGPKFSDTFLFVEECCPLQAVRSWGAPVMSTF